VTSASAAPTSGGDVVPSVSLRYAYDAPGEPTSLVGFAGTIGYGYNPDSILNQVTDPAGGVFGLTHDGNGRQTGMSVVPESPQTQATR
jgi:hypothetical protein